jgi:hypothetical protein
MGIKDGPARVGTVVQVHRRSGPHLAQGRPDPVARYESAYWGTPAAHARAREAVGVAEFDPEPSAPGKLAKNRRCKSPTGKV